MSRSAPGFYAFRAFQPPTVLPSMVWEGDRLRVEGQLFRFPSVEARDAWVTQALGASGDWRSAHTTRGLPTGWKVEEALRVEPEPSAGAAPPPPPGDETSSDADRA